ncbi:hypothetical protein K438DRAFT_1985828 [Mycena galopus ATCC 62051]|nr:hypothetical protein K438DRAFT_1985828 [Mycena galopus ATCC 62051]
MHLYGPQARVKRKRLEPYETYIRFCRDRHDGRDLTACTSDLPAFIEKPLVYGRLATGRRITVSAAVYDQRAGGVTVQVRREAGACRWYVAVSSLPSPLSSFAYPSSPVPFPPSRSPPHSLHEYPSSFPYSPSFLRLCYTDRHTCFSFNQPLLLIAASTPSSRPRLPIRSSAGHTLTLINLPLPSTRVRPSPHPPSHTLPSIPIPLQTFDAPPSFHSSRLHCPPTLHSFPDSLFPLQSRDEKNYSHVNVFNGGVKTRKSLRARSAP